MKNVKDTTGSDDLYARKDPSMDTKEDDMNKLDKRPRITTANLMESVDD